MRRFNPHAFKNTAEVVDAAIATPPETPRLTPETAFIAAYGRPGANKVAVGPGQMAVTLCLKFNDSAAQVDYFDYHARLGCPDFLVLLVPGCGSAKRQAQTENLARKALALCPELHSLDWQWKSERYAGGHGNYLISSPVELPPPIRDGLSVRKTYGGDPVTHAFWEIEFIHGGRDAVIERWPHKHFGRVPLSDTPGVREIVTGTVTAAWRLNDVKNGVEIHFTRRPDDATLNSLRADRAWRYTGFSKCWYARQTPETIAFAKGFCDRFNGVSMVPLVPPLEMAAARERRIIHFNEVATAQ